MISKKIEYFITLAECLSFTQTAARYDVSQTAISQYIAGLEDRLGVRLFDRSQRSVSLTEAGRYYYTRVKDMARNYEETLRQMHAIAAHYRGCLRVGVGMYENCSTERFFFGFLKKHPEVRLDILQYPYSTLTEKLKLGELDAIVAIGLCEEAFPSRELNSRLLFRSPNYLVATEEVAGRYATPAEMLRGECLITNCEEGGPSSMNMLRKMLICEYGFVPEMISMTNSVGAQLMMVRARHGCAIVPGFVAEKLAPELPRYALPSGEESEYKLMTLKSGTNACAEVLMSFIDEQ